jgi:Protein of unknown function (DUF2934)
MFNRGKGRAARSSSSDVGGIRLAENRASELENRVPDYHAPLDEQIRTRAYQLYLERGAQPNGIDVRDWLRAERAFTKHHT